MSRGLLALATLVPALWLAAPASAEITSVFGGSIPCQEQADGVRWCGGSDTRVATFDGQMIDVNVALPPAPANGKDGPYPLVMVFHGYGGSEFGLSALERWTGRGYAAFSMSDRGFGRSCGGKDQLTEPGCESGYVRLMDTRYEVRDAQTFAGILADEGVADRKRIGATGGSYGGGMSMALAALKNRTMRPNGKLVRWRSPEGRRMKIAAAVPEVPWTDLANALMPNGATLDYVADAPYGQRVGVMKQTYVSALFASGAAAGNYAPPLVDPEADLVTWFATISAGEPYGANPLMDEILGEIRDHHSSYYIDSSIPPAPLLISNGWTDDIFPVDEAVRFYNRTRTEHPDADISMFHLDYGHPRGQNKNADIERLAKAQNKWFAFYLKGKGRKPFQGVEALTQTCPKEVPSQGPYRAKNWAKLAPGEIRFKDKTTRTVAPLTTNDSGLSFDPTVGKGACATTPVDDPDGTVNLALPAAKGSGYTLLGSPTLVADISSPGPHSQLAARLLDVAPDGTQTLVSRGLVRLAGGLEAKRQVFQLHPNAYRFGSGHVAKIQLLPADAPYSRPTDGQGPVTLSNVQVRLPVRERPGSDGARIGNPAPKLVPKGLELARDFAKQAAKRK